MGLAAPPVNQGTCSCGAVQITTITSPMLVYNCHCSHCRGFVKKDFSMSSLYWSFCIKVTGSVDSEVTTGPAPGMGLVRTRCSRCKQNVCDWGDKLVRPLAFPSAQVLNLSPTMNVFYDSGKKKGAMGLTTFRGDFMSFLIHAVPVLTVGVLQLFWLEFMWIKTSLFRSGHGSEQEKNDWSVSRMRVRAEARLSDDLAQTRFAPHLPSTQMNYEKENRMEPIWKIMDKVDFVSYSVLLIVQASFTFEGTARLQHAFRQTLLCTPKPYLLKLSNCHRK